jgi:hypothetical protein
MKQKEMKYLGIINSPEDFQKIRKLLKLDEPWIQFRPRVECSDGFSVSIQASHGTYCQPRNNHGGYYQVELGYPNQIVNSWLEFMEGDFEFTNPCDTVYSYVPVEIVFEELLKHGELKVDESKFTTIPEEHRAMYDRFDFF